MPPLPQYVCSVGARAGSTWPISGSRLARLSPFRTLEAIELGQKCSLGAAARFRRDQVVRAVVDDQLAKVFGAVFDSSDPDIGIVDHMLPGFPPKRHGFVQAGVALLFDLGRPVG